MGHSARPAEQMRRSEYAPPGGLMEGLTSASYALPKSWSYFRPPALREVAGLDGAIFGGAAVASDAPVR